MPVAVRGVERKRHSTFLFAFNLCLYALEVETALIPKEVTGCIQQGWISPSLSWSCAEHGLGELGLSLGVSEASMSPVVLAFAMPFAASFTSYQMSLQVYG